MKNILLAISLVLISGISFSQTWQWSNPNPTSNELRSCYFVDENIGYTVGEAGLIMKTSDGGISWRSLNSGTKAYLTSVFFINELKGFCTGVDWNSFNGVLLSTENGGTTWDIQVFDATYDTYELNQVFFIDPNIGFLTCYNGKIFKTTNGGIDWEYFDTELTYSLNSICFLDSNIGWIGGMNHFVGGDDDGLILKTIDGGNHWAVASYCPLTVLSLSFANQSIGYAVGYDGIIKTSDGGQTWSTIYTTGGYNGLYSVFCHSVDSVTVVGGNGLIINTIDGGTNWDTIPSGTNQNLYCLFAGNQDAQFIVGGYGTVLRKNSNENTWMPLSHGILKDLSTICFTDESNGYCLVSEDGFLKTTDAGLTWSYNNIGDSYYWLSSLRASSKTTLHVLGAGTAYFPHDSVFIFKSTDAGESWNITYWDMEKQLISLFFLDSLNGFACGYDLSSGGAFILKTTDAGDLWALDQTFHGYVIRAIFYTDPLTGYIAGDGIIMKTSDGGVSWETHTAPGDIHSLWFIDSSTGFACGQDGWNGFLMKTIDGGSNWSLQDLGSPPGLNGVTFQDNQTGYVFGKDGFVYKTTDCGLTWNFLHVNTNNSLESVCITESGTIYISGTYGTLLTSADSGHVVEVKEKIPFISGKAYPNPARDYFTLEMPKYSSDARYSIYNMNGQGLISGEINNTKTQIDLTDFPPGVYIFRVIDREETHTGKIIKE
ncbi:MAG: T9SS type A sorting domain-containing protein [Bacteroidales bacterium]|nr:T9SS type A sorting domain-containing protein [Bacteroidales bacterium]